MTYNKKNIEDINVAGKKCLVRCDFNVPVKDGVITSEKRIVEALPTIKYLKAQGAMVILCSHMQQTRSTASEQLKQLQESFSWYVSTPFHVLYCHYSRYVMISQEFFAIFSEILQKHLTNGAHRRTIYANNRIKNQGC